MNRRKFLVATGAVVTAAPAALKSEVSAKPHKNDRGAFKIDCQSHLFAPELVALMEKRKADPVVFTKAGVR